MKVSITKDEVFEYLDDNLKVGDMADLYWRNELVFRGILQSIEGEIYVFKVENPE